MTNVLPEGSIIDVHIQIRLPAAATQEQVEEWFNFAALDGGSMQHTNPLSDEAVETWRPAVFSETGFTGHEEKINERVEGNVTFYQLQRRLEPIK